MIPSLTGTFQRSPSSVSPCRPLALFLSNPASPVEFSKFDPGANFYTAPFTADNQGWTTVEIVTIQLNTSSTPSGRFSVYSNHSLPDANGIETRIGYDAAVCVQKYEPWIIEAYNTSFGSSYALQIVEKVDSSTPMSPSGNIRGPRIANTRYLNTTGKDIAFISAHSRSVNQVKSVNYGRSPYLDDYIPPPTVGPVTPLRATSFQALTHSTVSFFHRWRWTSGVHRTLSRPVRQFPRTGWCCLRSTIPRGVWTRRRTIIWERDVSICHLQAVATDSPPGSSLDPGDHWGSFRAGLTI